jgi:hypothetical protein
VTDTDNLKWRKSSHSDANGDCVEIARLDDGTTAVRHSHQPNGPVIVYTPSEWDAFLKGVRDGEFDL